MGVILHKGMTALQRQVRRGFLIAVVVASSVVGSTLWAAISVIPYLQFGGRTAQLTRFGSRLAGREGTPPELSWFFIQYPYLSQSLKVRSKNHHTFVVSDLRRGREYVVILGQAS